MTIPRLYHFVFGLKPQTSPFHLIHYLALESCLRVNRPDALLFHYHHEPFGEYWDLIRDRITPLRIRRPEVALRYDDQGIEAYRYAHESDFVRLDVLLEHGGVYADIDTLFVRHVPDHLFAHPFVLGREDDIVCQKTGFRRQSICNAFIMSPPRSPFGTLWRERMEETFDGSWSRHSTILPAELAMIMPDDIHVEPSVTFYRFMWTREDLRHLFEGSVDPGEEVVSVHLWAHLWWSRWRKDFSGVHAAMFTEDYIRNVPTTFNLLARPHLPPRRRPLRPLVRCLDNSTRYCIGKAREASSLFRKAANSARRALR